MAIEARCVSLTGFLVVTLTASRECLSCVCLRRLLQVPVSTLDYA